MGKYFGTDGFRGEANKNLTADHAYKIGRFLGWYYGELKKLFFVKHFSLKKASEFPVFSEGFSLL